jgi:hypothetical protein
MRARDLKLLTGLDRRLPTCPAATSTLLLLQRVIRIDAVSPRLAMRTGSSQSRMEYLRSRR